VPKLRKITKKQSFQQHHPWTQIFSKYLFGALGLKIKVVMSNIYYVNT
jgi:hypothetical protein